MNAIRQNAMTLQADLDWFSRVLEVRIGIYFEHENALESIYQVPPPDLTEDGSDYARMVRDNGLDFDERIVLLLALIPHVRPQLLDTFFISNQNFNRGFTEFGGVKGNGHGGFLPTGETASFILAGSDLGKRLELLRLFDEDHLFCSRQVLWVEPPSRGEPFFSGALVISGEYLSRLTTGLSHRPDYSIGFPAKRITTRLCWEDLVLPPEVLEEIDDISAWIRHAQSIMGDWGLGRSIKPGYRSLFHGPPGTGKTLTANLIGAAAGIDVYRIDLSMVVSKFIGETEKNLSQVFDQAACREWILFFDEADALFGKRTNAASSNDRYANQEVSYLLQRVEDHPGVVILATNLKANIDDAFARRFQSVVYFPMPDAEQRLRLWEGMLHDNERLDSDVDLARLAEEFELSGGAITNIVRYGALKAVQGSAGKINQQDLLRGISRELRKEGKTVQGSMR